jgi:hypothetical protein
MPLFYEDRQRNEGHSGAPVNVNNKWSKSGIELCILQE